MKDENLFVTEIKELNRRFTVERALAGSIGKRAAVLVPHSTGKIWYWHENDENSFWYPSLKLFYQDNPLTWDQNIEDCTDWVKSL